MLHSRTHMPFVHLSRCYLHSLPARPCSPSGSAQAVQAVHMEAEFLAAPLNSTT